MTGSLSGPSQQSTEGDEEREGEGGGGGGGERVSETVLLQRFCKTGLTTTHADIPT